MCQPVTLVRLQYAYTTKQFSAGQVSQDVEPSPNELTQAPSLHLLHGSLVCAQVGVVDINATPPNARAVPNTRRLIMVRMACLQDGCLIERLTGFQEHILETLSIDAQYPPPGAKPARTAFGNASVTAADKVTRSLRISCVVERHLSLPTRSRWPLSAIPARRFGRIPIRKPPKQIERNLSYHP